MSEPGGKPRIGVVVSLDGGGEDQPASTVPPAGLDTVLDGQARSGLEPLDAAVDPVPALTPALLDLARWAAEETSSAWGEAVARALPPGLRSGAPPDLVPAGAPRESGRLVVMSGTRRGPAIEAAVAAAVDRDEGVLCLAPEIDQARAWAERLGRRVGTPLHLATSAEPASRRWRAWWAARQGTARIVEHLGKIIAYATSIAFFGHAVAETNQGLMALIGAAPAFPGGGFLVPTRNGELFRWCLRNELHLVHQMTLMTIALYNEPEGAYLPSVLY